MMISHESPLVLLNKSLEYNDYEYILPYFLKRFPKYCEFNKKAKEAGRFSILDNGLFEDETYSDPELLSLILEYKPNVFIAPDAWNDSETTSKHAGKWHQMLHYSGISKTTELMVVLQGNSFYELIELFDRCYTNGIRRFAINHSSKAFDSLSITDNSSLSKTQGRINFVNNLNKRLKNNKITDVKIHLLGCNLPQEFIFYRDLDIIESIDTSNPIITGIQGKTYSCLGESEKPEGKMELYFNEVFREADYQRIFFNIEAFRKQIMASTVVPNSTPEYKSLYEFMGRAAGKEKGSLVYSLAKESNIKTRDQQISNPGYAGKVLTYPVDFLQTIEALRV